VKPRVCGAHGATLAHAHTRVHRLTSQVAFNLGLYKSRGLICTSWFLFGKGNFIWVLLAVKFAHDWRPDLIPSPVDMGLFKIGTFI